MTVASVSTTAGLLPAAELGRTLMHEHLTTLVPGGYLSGGGNDAHELGVRATARLRELGFEAVVNLSGRHVPDGTWETVAGIAEATGLHVVAGFAHYTERWWPAEVAAWSPERMTEVFVEAATAIPGTTVPAGIYGEVATSMDVITPGEERALRAVARAHRVTGLPIATHCSLGTMAAEQVEILADAGAALEQVVIGHVDLRPDVDALEPLLRRGVTLAFDTFGKEHFDYVLRKEESYEPENELKRLYTRRDSARADALAELVRRGWAGQLVLSTDMTGRETYLNPETHGALGYAFLPERVVPLLGERGVGDAQLETMLRENPARLLTVRS